MKNIRLSILTLFVSSALFAQNKGVDNVFLNEAYRQVLKYDSSYFILENRIYTLRLSEDHLSTYYKQLKRKISFKLAIQNKAIVLASSRNIDSMERNWNVSTPINKRLFYISSTPVFDNRKQFAILEFSGGEGLLKMLGRKYLFKKINKEWKLIATFDSWVS